MLICNICNQHQFNSGYWQRLMPPFEMELKRILIVNFLWDKIMAIMNVTNERIQHIFVNHPYAYLEECDLEHYFSLFHTILR